MNQPVGRIDELREALGGAHELAVNKVKDHLEPFVQGFIENAPFAILSSADSEGNCDASPKGGLPGFIKVVDDRTLLVPDIGGNRLFQTYQNFETNPKAGLLFLIPGLNVTVRVNGRVRLLENDKLAEQGITAELSWTDDNSGLVQGMLLDVDEAYFHCPRSMQFADLWNTDTITANSKLSLKSLKKD